MKYLTLFVCALFLIGHPIFSQADEVKEIDFGMPTTEGGELARHYIFLLNQFYGSNCNADQLTKVLSQFNGASDLSQGIAGKNTGATLQFFNSLKPNSNCNASNDGSNLCLRYLDLNYGKRIRELMVANGCAADSKWKLKVAVLSCDKIAPNYALPEKKVSRNTCHYVFDKCHPSSLNSESPDLKNADSAGYGLRCSPNENICPNSNKPEEITECKLADAHGFFKMGSSFGLGTVKLNTSQPVIINLQDTGAQ